MREMRVLTIGGETATTDTESQIIDWGLAKGHVIRLKKIRFVLDAVFDTGSDQIWWCLMRGSKTPPTSLVMNTYAPRADMVAAGRVAYAYNSNGDGVSIGTGIDEWVCPDGAPVTIIRPSQFLVDGGATLDWGAYIYYEQERVSDEDMMRLMKMYHA